MATALNSSRPDWIVGSCTDPPRVSFTSRAVSSATMSRVSGSDRASRSSLFNEPPLRHSRSCCFPRAIADQAGVPVGVPFAGTRQPILRRLDRCHDPARRWRLGPTDPCVERGQGSPPPTVVINAKDDPLSAFDNAAWAAQRIPGAKLVTAATGGHLLLGNEQRVREEVAALSGVDRAPSPGQ